MSEVPVVAVFVAKPGREAELESLLRGIVAPTHAEQGVLQYDLHRDTQEPRRFVFVERWASLADLERHGQTPHIQNLRAQLPELTEYREIDVLTKL